MLILLAAAAVSVLILSVGFFRREYPGMGRTVARVDITGVITSSEEIVDRLRKISDDRGIRAVLVRIDSPGGGVVPSQEIHRELERIRRQGRQKVAVSIGNLGASGGYYIASAANRIWANPGSLVGSIGVILEVTKVGELLGKIGVATEVVKSGPYKDMASPLRPSTADERQILQGVIDDTHRQFVAAVAGGRNLPLERVAELADGRVFTGSQARELGLVDELGGYQEALAGVARMAGIEGTPKVAEPSRRWSLRRLLQEASLRLGSFVPGSGSSGLLYLWRP